MSLVEWPEKAPNLVPDNAVVIHIEILDPNRRSIYINHKLATVE
jgi:tRNA A37 threonylcarbamoyladenosine biosynthesis protein TsaE